MDNEVEVKELGKVMITPKGEYSLSKSYEILDAVSYNGSSYVSKINYNTSVPTSDAWQLLAQKGDTYELSEEDLQRIAEQITSNANSAFNQNVKEKTDGFNSNANSKTEAYNTNATEKLGTYNSNNTAKLKEYNDNATSKLSAYSTNTVTKTTEYNSNHTNKLKAYNTNADSKIEEYNTNANSKILEYDKHSEELRNMAISTNNELERVKNEILDTGSASDSFVHVEDSCMAKIKELEIEGVINQKTTTGKNLFDENNLTRNLVLENGDITTNASWNMSNYIEVSGNTNYVVKRNDTTSASQSFILIEFDADKKIIKRNIQGVRNTNIPYTITTTDTTRYLIFNYNNTYNNTMLQLEKGDTPTDYEKYTGGKPSPSPDYPQEIENIANIFNIISCNKNIFNFNETKNLKTYNSEYKFENNILEITPSTQWGYVEVIQKVKPNTTYVYSFEMDFEGIDKPSTWWVSLNDNNGTDYNKGLISFKDNKITKVIRTTDSCQLQIKFTSSTTIKPTKTIFKNIQLEENTSPTNYEMNALSKTEVNLPQEEFLGKLNDNYKDVLTFKYDSSDSMVHAILNKKIGKIVLDGTQEMSRISTKSGKYRWRVKIPNNIINNNVNCLCDCLITGDLNNSYNNVDCITTIIINNDYYGNITFYREDFADKTVSEVKQLLAQNNMIIYYALQTPYTKDLGVFKIPLAYKEVTNIFTNSDLFPKITAKYYRTFQTTIQNLQINDKTLKQEITDLNNSISDISKRLEALESANVNTVEESEASNDLQN